MNSKRAALWTRVSTRDQTPEQQEEDLRALASREGFEPVKLYSVKESARRGERSAFHQMMADAEARAFDVLLFWNLKRFSREGIANTIGYIRRLDLCGVSVMSYAEPYINTDNELVRHIVLGVLADIAKSKADWTSEQVKRGLKAAKAKGKRLGAPSKFFEHKQRVIDLKRRGLSNYAVAKRLKLSPSTVSKYVELLTEDINAAAHSAR